MNKATRPKLEPAMSEPIPSPFDVSTIPTEDEPIAAGMTDELRQFVKSNQPQPIPEDSINPSHYRRHPSGVECIEITRHMNFNVGNAIKYLWRYMDKGDPIENLKKAQWYIEDEINRLGRKL